MDTLATLLAGLSLVIGVVSCGFFFCMFKEQILDTQEEFKKVKRAVIELQEEREKCNKEIHDLQTKLNIMDRDLKDFMITLGTTLAKLKDMTEHDIEDLWIQTNLNRKNIESLKRKVKKL